MFLENLLELLVFLLLGGLGFYFYKAGYLLHRSIVNVSKNVPFQSIATNYALGSGLVFASMLACAGFLDKEHRWDLASIISSGALSIVLGLIVLIGSRAKFAGQK